VVPVEELVSDADPTLEWSIADLASDASGGSPGGARTPLPELIGDAAVDLTSEPVFQWTEASQTRESGPVATTPPVTRRETPPPIPVGYGRDNGAARRITGEQGAVPTPPPQAQAKTSSEGSDEILLVVDTPPTPTSAAAIMSVPPAGNEAPRAQARAPSPPPVPPAAAHGPILLPDIPVDLVGSVAPGAWPEALSQRPRKKRLRPWFEEVFDEDYLRTLPFMTAEQTLREVGFIKEALSPPAEGHLLDVACGYGRHAIELSQRGLRVTGLDLSLPLLIRAADESQRRALSVNFVHADMREMAFDGQFDGAYCVLSSFGYFDEETNLKVASSVCRALKPGGRFLLDIINRDYVVSDLPTRVWWEGDGCVVLEEVDFNFHTSRMIIRRSIVFQDGRQLEQDISIRAYSLHELGKLLRQAGFRVLDVSGSLATKGHFFGATSRNIIMVCERPAG
jgi:SAM-dependent methyltransferase